MELSDGEVIDTAIGNVNGITLGIDIGTDMVSLEGYFDVSNDDKVEGLYLGDSMKSTDGGLLGYDEAIKLGLSDGKVIYNIHGNVDGITPGIDVGS